MKTTLKVLGAIFGLGLVILLLLHLFLLYGLTKTMREVVLPRVKAETGLDVRVDRLSINVVQGRLYLKGVAVRNPEGFLLENMASIDQVDMEVDIPSLFRQDPVLVKQIRIEEALLNVVRNKDGEINVARLQQRRPPTAPADRMPPQDIPERPEERPSPGTASDAEPAAPLPELLIESLSCRARIRYIDFRLDQFDVALDLRFNGESLSTQQDPAAPWGSLDVSGALGDDRTRFVTDLNAALAPVTDINALSFDLTGRIMEIDPRLMEEIYDKLGIRSAPFGFDPELHCRASRFERSSFALNLTDIRFEDKLARKLGGVGSIDMLRFPVPVEGTLQEPEINVQSALMTALGGNAQTLLDVFLKGAAAREAGLEEPPDDLADAAVEILGQHVEEIGENEAAKKVLKDLAGGKSSDTNAPSQPASDILIDILGEEVDEIGGNEVLKEDLKGIVRGLFGN